MGLMEPTQALESDILEPQALGLTGDPIGRLLTSLNLFSFLFFLSFFFGLRWSLLFIYLKNFIYFFGYVGS